MKSPCIDAPKASVAVITILKGELKTSALVMPPVTWPVVLILNRGGSPVAENVSGSPSAEIVPRTRAAAATEPGEVSVSDRQRAMSWAQRLKRVFAIDIETCRQCGGRLRVIASIEQPAIIERILDHLGHTQEPIDPAHPSRAPPQGDRLV